MFKKIHNFFVYWFWWKWRALKYDRDSNLGRNEAFEFINKLFDKGFYAYLANGSVLKYHRDNTMKNQDMDIVISKETYESDFFWTLIKKYNLKNWSKIYINKKIKIHKFLLRNRIPFEFFITDNNDKEVTFSIHNSIVYGRTIDIQKLKKYNYNGKTVVMPKNIEDYLVSVYGKKYMTPIKNGKYNWTKHSNLETLFKTNFTIEEIDY